MVAVVIHSAAFESLKINGVAVCMGLTIIPIEYGGCWNPLLLVVGESLHLTDGKQSLHQPL